MDFSRRDHRSNFLKNFRERLSKLQASGFKAKPSLERLKTIRGLSLLFFSILLASISLSATESSSVSRYRLKAWPPQTIWNQTLEAKGLKNYFNLGDFSRPLQAHPDAFSQQPSIWISQAPLLIYITASPFRDRSPEMWAESNALGPKKSTKSTNWVNLGSGWVGFEKLLELLTNHRQNVPREARSPVNIVDPKEIRY